MAIREGPGRPGPRPGGWRALLLGARGVQHRGCPTWARRPFAAAAMMATGPDALSRRKTMTRRALAAAASAWGPPGSDGAWRTLGEGKNTRVK